MITSIGRRLLPATVAICGASLIFAGGAAAGTAVGTHHRETPSATTSCDLQPSCGSFELTALGLDMASNNSHTVIEAKIAVHATNNNSEDFQPSTVNGFTRFQFDPFGTPSGLCVTAQSADLHAGILLKACANNVLQFWTPLGSGIYQLDGTVFVLSDPFGGGQYTPFQLRNNSHGPGQKFTLTKF